MNRHRATIDDHLQKLADLRDRAEEAEEFGSAIRAEELRGKALGFYIERTMVTHVDLARDEILDRLSLLQQSHPGLLDQMNRDLGTLVREEGQKLIEAGRRIEEMEAVQQSQQVVMIEGSSRSLEIQNDEEQEDGVRKSGPRPPGVGRDESEVTEPDAGPEPDGRLPV